MMQIDAGDLNVGRILRAQKKGNKVRFIKIIIFIFISFLLSSCSSEFKKVLSTTNDGMNIELVFSRIEVGQGKLYGHLKIDNSNQKSSFYTNKNLFIRIKNCEARAYVDSPASFLVDNSEIEIKPSGSMELDVFFMLPKEVMKGRLSQILGIELIYKKDHQ